MSTLESILKRSRSPVMVAGVAVAASALAGCEQPKPGCTVAHGDFAATFERVSGDDTGPCAELSIGVLNVQGYPTQTSEDDKLPNYDETTIAIQTQDTTDLVWGGRTLNPDDTIYAFGSFDTATPDSEGYCTASELSVARVRAEATEEMMPDECTTVPAMPAVDMRYEWTNVRVLSTAANYGNLLEADLEYTVGDCTANYKVRGVFPAVACGVDGPVEDAGMPMADAGGDGMCPPPEPPPPPQVPEMQLCDPEPSEFTGGFGSGLSPDFDIVCDPDALMCVLAD